jgi:hypothetical protein
MLAFYFQSGEFASFLGGVFSGYRQGKKGKKKWITAAR